MSSIDVAIDKLIAECFRDGGDVDAARKALEGLIHEALDEHYSMGWDDHEEMYS